MKSLNRKLMEYVLDDMFPKFTENFTSIGVKKVAEEALTKFIQMQEEQEKIESEITLLMCKKLVKEGKQ